MANKHPKRRYDLEYARYHSKPAQIKRRSLRNQARRKMAKKVGASKLKGKDVNHVSPGNLKKSRLTIESPSRNRGFRRSKTGKNLGLPPKKKRS